MLRGQLLKKRRNCLSAEICTIIFVVENLYADELFRRTRTGIDYFPFSKGHSQGCFCSFKISQSLGASRLCWHVILVHVSTPRVNGGRSTICLLFLVCPKIYYVNDMLTRISRASLCAGNESVHGSPTARCPARDRSCARLRLLGASRYVPGCVRVIAKGGTDYDLSSNSNRTILFLTILFMNIVARDIFDAKHLQFGLR